MQKSTVLLLIFCFSSWILADDPVAMNCEDGWKWHDRPSGGWCMRVFAGSYTWDDAEAKCNEVGAVLTGVQRYTEIFSYMTGALFKYTEPKINEKESLAQFNNVTSHITDFQPNYWVGGRRVERCMYRQLDQHFIFDANGHMQIFKEGCSRFLAFNWTDGITTAQMAGNMWDRSEPNNRGGYENCLAVRANNNYLNDFRCDLANVTRGYACGKAATF